MSSIRLAAAQSVSVPADISANVRTHCEFIIAARRAAVDLLIFPELSLSGYELPLLRNCLVEHDDMRLAAIRDCVRETGVTAVVGAPVDSGSTHGPFIAAITFYPDGTASLYRKQHLHSGEEKFVVKGGTTNPVHTLGDHSYALAICADTSYEAHVSHAAAEGASLYLAGALVSEAGYDIDAGKLASYAARFSVGVLLSNHGGPSGQYLSAGKSAFWAPGGRLVVRSAGNGSCLVVADRRTGVWTGEVVEIENEPA
jgi:predicted amidohydrolase